MIDMAHGFDLKLVFVDRRGDYLSDVKVRIDDEHDQQILSTTSDGPWLYVKLPDGKYNVKAEFGKSTEPIKSVAISRGHQLRKVFRWDLSA